MKAFVILCFAILGVKGFAQEPEPGLQEFTWVLQEMSVNGVVYSPPGQGGEANTITLDIFPDEITTTACGTITAPIISASENDQTLTIGPYITSGDSCEFNENQLFEDSYFQEVLLSALAENTYDYLLFHADPAPPYELKLTNSNGDWVHFWNAFFMTPTNELQNIHVYPNPVSEILHIQSKEPLQKVTFYDVLGQSLMTVHKDFEVILMSSLPTGLYFVEVRTAAGSLIKRVVRE